MTCDLSALVLKTAAEACGITTAETLSGRDEPAIEARQLTAWLLHQIAEWTPRAIGDVLDRDKLASERVLGAAYSKRRRDSVWRAKADRLLARLQRDEENDEDDEPAQLDLLAPVDTSSRPDPCTNWGFEEHRSLRYFVELNEKAVRAMKAGLAQEAKEREAKAA